MLNFELFITAYPDINEAVRIVGRCQPESADTIRDCIYSNQPVVCCDAEDTPKCCQLRNLFLALEEAGISVMILLDGEELTLQALESHIHLLQVWDCPEEGIEMIQSSSNEKAAVSKDFPKDEEPHAFQAGDLVSFCYKNQEYTGTIMSIGKKNATVSFYDTDDSAKIPLDNLTFIPPIVLSQEELRMFCRFETFWHDLFTGYDGDAYVVIEQPYDITAEDLITAVRNIAESGFTNKSVTEGWYDILCSFIFEPDESNEDGHGFFFFEPSPESAETHRFLPDRSSRLRWFVQDNLSDYLYDGKPVCQSSEEIIRKIQEIADMDNVPLLERPYSSSSKRYFIRQFSNDDSIKKASGPELEIYRRFVDDLCAEDDVSALKCKGYGCYGGNAAYECDWKTSLECMLKLYKLTGNPQYANTLGYIYYYGRCWDGEPQYAEAFSFFSIGAAGTYYESRYKLADMFEHGYGTQKNPRLAYQMLNSMYDENYKYIAEGEFDCKYADIAFRLGSYCQKGYQTGEPDLTMAYIYYLLAHYAIQRRLQYNHYGDTSVAQRIQKALSEIQELDEIRELKRTAHPQPEICFIVI